jgi:tagatose 6-phosphate kinase
MAYILTVGLNPALQKTLVFDHYRPDAVNRASSSTHLASGKGINVSRTLSILGHQTVCTGILGGPNGVLIEEDLKKEKLHSAFTSIAGSTRLCITLIDKERSSTTELIEPSPSVTSHEVDRWIHAYESLVPWSLFVTISGTSASGFPDNLYKRLIYYAHKNKKPVLIDCGGSFWRDGAEAEPEIIKSNEEEILEGLALKNATIDSLTREAEKHVKGSTNWLVITRGADPAVFITKTFVYSAKPPRIAAVNPIGSGDAVSAGMVAGLLDGLDEEGVVRFALACGSANALVSGPGIVRPSDVKRLTHEVQIKKTPRS